MPLTLLVHVTAAWGLAADAPGHNGGAYAVVSETVRSAALHCSDPARLVPRQETLDSCAGKYADLAAAAPRTVQEMLREQEADGSVRAGEGPEGQERPILYLGSALHDLKDDWDALANTPMAFHVLELRPVAEKQAPKRPDKKQQSTPVPQGAGGTVTTAGIGAMTLQREQPVELVNLAPTIVGTGFLDLQGLISGDGGVECEQTLSIVASSQAGGAAGKGAKKDDTKGKRPGSDASAAAAAVALGQGTELCKLRVRIHAQGKLKVPFGITLGVNGIFGFAGLGTRKHPGPFCTQYQNRYDLVIGGVSGLQNTWENTDADQGQTIAGECRRAGPRIAGGYHAIIAEGGNSPVPLISPLLGNACICTAVNDSAKTENSMIQNPQEDNISGQEILIAANNKEPSPDRNNSQFHSLSGTDRGWKQAHRKDEFCIAFPEYAECKIDQNERQARIIEAMRRVILVQMSQQELELNEMRHKPQEIVVEQHGTSKQASQAQQKQPKKTGSETVAGSDASGAASVSGASVPSPRTKLHQQQQQQVSKKEKGKAGASDEQIFLKKSVVYDIILQDGIFSSLKAVFRRNNPQWIQITQEIATDGGLQCSLSLSKGAMTPQVLEFIKSHLREEKEETTNEVTQAEESIQDRLNKQFMLNIPKVWSNSRKIITEVVLPHPWDPMTPEYAEWVRARDKIKKMEDATVSVSSTGVSKQQQQQQHQAVTVASACLAQPCPDDVHATISYWTLPLAKSWDANNALHPWIQLNTLNSDVYVPKADNGIDTTDSEDVDKFDDNLAKLLEVSKQLKDGIIEEEQKRKEEQGKRIKYEPEKHSISKLMNNDEPVKLQTSRRFNKNYNGLGTRSTGIFNFSNLDDNPEEKKSFDLCAIVGSILAEAGVYLNTDCIKTNKCVIPIDLRPSWLVSKSQIKQIDYETGNNSYEEEDNNENYIHYRAHEEAEDIQNNNKSERPNENSRDICNYENSGNGYVCAGMFMFGLGFGSGYSLRKKMMQALAADGDVTGIRNIALLSLILAKEARETEAIYLVLSHLVEQGSSQLYTSLEAVEMLLLLVAWILLGDNEKKGPRRKCEALRVLAILMEIDSNSVTMYNRKLLPSYAEDVNSLANGGKASLEGMGELVNALSHFGFFFNKIPYDFDSLDKNSTVLVQTARGGMMNGNHLSKQTEFTETGSKKTILDKKVMIYKLLFTIYETFASTLTSDTMEDVSIVNRNCSRPIGQSPSPEEEYSDYEMQCRDSPFNMLLVSHMELYAPIPEFWVAYALSMRSMPKLFSRIMAQALEAWLVIGEDGSLQPPVIDRYDNINPAWRNGGVFSLFTTKLQYPYLPETVEELDMNGGTLVETARTYDSVGVLCNLLLDSYPLWQEEKLAREADVAFNGEQQERNESGDFFANRDNGNGDDITNWNSEPNGEIANGINQKNQQLDQQFPIQEEDEAPDSAASRTSKSQNLLPVSRVPRESSILLSEPLPAIPKQVDYQSQQQNQQSSSQLHQSQVMGKPGRSEAGSKASSRQQGTKSPFFAQSLQSISVENNANNSRPSVSLLKLRVTVSAKSRGRTSSKSHSSASNPTGANIGGAQNVTSGQQALGNLRTVSGTVEPDMLIGMEPIDPIPGVATSHLASASSPLVIQIPATQSTTDEHGSGTSGSEGIVVEQDPSQLIDEHGDENENGKELIRGQEVGNIEKAALELPDVDASNGITKTQQGEQKVLDSEQSQRKEARGSTNGLNHIGIANEDLEMPPLPEQPSLMDLTHYVVVLLSQYLEDPELPCPELLPAYHCILGRVYLLRAISTVSRGAEPLAVHVGVFSNMAEPVVLTSSSDFLSAASAEFSTALELQQSICDAAGVGGCGSPAPAGYLTYLLSRFAPPLSLSAEDAADAEDVGDSAMQDSLAAALDADSADVSADGTGGIDDPRDSEVLHMLSAEAVQLGLTSAWADETVVGLCRDIALSSYGSLLEGAGPVDE